MSAIEIIDSIEEGLKAALTQKSGLRKVVEKVNQSEPMVGNAYGYDHRAARLMNEAQSAFQRAANETDAATRKLAAVIGLIDDGIERKRVAQTDAFSQGDGAAAEEPEVQGNPLMLGDGNHPSIDIERTRPGGDAHDSFSLHLIQGADGELPELRPPFEFDDRRFVAVAMSPGYWIEACEVLTPDEAKETEFVAGAGLAGQRAVVSESIDGEPAIVEVVLGNRVRFVVEREEEAAPEISGDGVATDEIEHPGHDEEVEEVEGDELVEDAEEVAEPVSKFTNATYPWETEDEEA